MGKDSVAVKSVLRNRCDLELRDDVSRDRERVLVRLDSVPVELEAGIVGNDSVSVAEELLERRDLELRVLDRLEPVSLEPSLDDEEESKSVVALAVFKSAWVDVVESVISDVDDGVLVLLVPVPVRVLVREELSSVAAELGPIELESVKLDVDVIVVSELMVVVETSELAEELSE